MGKKDKEIDKIKVGLSDISYHSEIPQSTLYNNNVYTFLTTEIEGIEYMDQKGSVIINIDEALDSIDKKLDQHEKGIKRSKEEDLVDMGGFFDGE